MASTKLSPTDLLDVLSNKQMIRRWLSNTTALKVYKDSVENELSMFSDVDAIKAYKNLANNLDNPKIDPIDLADIVIDYIDTVLSSWKHDSDDESALMMVSSLPLFVEMSKYLPHINPKDEYNYAFRGTELPDSTVKKFVKTSKPEEWKATSFNGRKFMLYTGPNSKKITYTPHRAVQSWSVSKQAATSFGDIVLAVPLDNTFFFDPKFMGEFGYQHEKETVHFGKNPMKVALLIPKGEYLDIRGDRKRPRDVWADITAGADMNESTEIRDEEGTLTLPGI